MHLGSYYCTIGEFHAASSLNEMRKPLAQLAQAENVPGFMPGGLDAVVT